METIFALATAPGKAGVSIVRISGPRASDALQELGCAVPINGRGLRTIRDEQGAIIDQALILHFERGKSFTGDEVVEIQGHGSPAVVKKLLRRLAQIEGLRLAEPGEFTRQAFENGQLDLTQVEGLRDLIDAETEAQRLQAQQIMDGSVRDLANDLRSGLIGVSALFTSAIDFSEEDIPEDVITQAEMQLDAIINVLCDQISGAGIAEKIRDGFEVAIVGAPNAGKSTLLNRLAGREAAIVSDIPGTTRDLLEIHMDLNGLAVSFIDTAGLREASDEIEAIGVQRALDRAEKSDLRVILDTGVNLNIQSREDDIILRAKADINPSENGISGKTGFGVVEMLAKIEAILSQRARKASLIAHERQRLALVQAKKDLEEAQQILLSDGDVTLVAELVNLAMRQLDIITGKVDVETVLGEIFSRFCIGK